MHCLKQQAPKTFYRLRPASQQAARRMSFLSPVSRFSVGEFTPIFRLLDDYASHQLNKCSAPSTTTTTTRSFQPRFDVKEDKDSYQLEGELPGINQKDINIEFTDVQTLTIRGHTKRSIQSDTSALEEITKSAQESTSHVAYQKPSVEDESSNPSDAGINTPTSTVVSTPEVKKVEQPKQRYWISERSTGQFSRTFNFPARVNQEGVKASLVNGILTITVPKAQAPVARKIQIQ